MGALCGSGIAYANYIHAIDLVEGGRHIRTVPGTAGLFSTYAMDYMTDDAEARNQEIYEENHRFERDRLERQWAFELASVVERAKAAGTVLHFSGSSVGSSSSASH